MAILTKGKAFGPTETVTSDKLHQLVDAAKFDDPVSSPLTVSGGKLTVADAGINAAKLASAAVTPEKVASTSATDFSFDRVTVTKRATFKTFVFNLSGGYTPNMLNGQVQIFTLTGNATLGITANVANDGASSFLFIIKQDGTGGRTVTWDSSLWKFPKGAAPTQTAAANAVDLYSIVWDGSAYYVTQLADYQ